MEPFAIVLISVFGGAALFIAIWLFVTGLIRKLAGMTRKLNADTGMLLRESPWGTGYVNGVRARGCLRVAEYERGWIVRIAWLLGNGKLWLPKSEARISQHQPSGFLSLRSSEIVCGSDKVLLYGDLSDFFEQAVPSRGAGPVKQSLGLVALVVRDYDEALAFYVGKLGFSLVEDTFVPEQSKRWVVVSPPGAVESRLLLARASTIEQLERIGDQTGGRVFLFLYTRDFWSDYESYKSKGIEFVRDPKEEPYGTVAVFKDLYGNMWDLVQPKRGMDAYPPP